MKIVWTIVVAAVAWYIGIWGWAQIIGSIQSVHVRGAKMTALTICIWLVILGGATAFVYFVLRSYLVSYLVGLGIALARILFAGKIR